MQLPEGLFSEALSFPCRASNLLPYTPPRFIHPTAGDVTDPLYHRFRRKKGQAVVSIAAVLTKTHEWLWRARLPRMQYFGP